jgi:hypothetical protein
MPLISYLYIRHANRGFESTFVFNRAILNKLEYVQKSSVLNFMFQRIPDLVHDFENTIEAKKFLIISFMPNILFFFEYPED